MSTLKDRTINHILEVEGGYVNDPEDSGGETNYGITVGVARRAGYSGDMIDMPRSFAFNIYAKQYWDSVMADDISIHSEEVAAEVVDTCVNMGVHRAGLFLQRSLNVLNGNAKLYPDIQADGRVGGKTISSLAGYKDSGRSMDAMLKALNSLQGAYYIELAERRDKDEKFLYGWLQNRVGM